MPETLKTYGVVVEEKFRLEKLESEKRKVGGEESRMGEIDKDEHCGVKKMKEQERGELTEALIITMTESFAKSRQVFKKSFWVHWNVQLIKMRHASWGKLHYSNSF